MREKKDDVRRAMATLIDDHIGDIVNTHGRELKPREIIDSISKACFDKIAEMTIADELMRNKGCNIHIQPIIDHMLESFHEMHEILLRDPEDTDA